MAKQQEKSKRMTVWVDKEFKDRGDEIIYELGMTPSSVINILYRQIVFQEGIPFEMRISHK